MAVWGISECVLPCERYVLLFQGWDGVWDPSISVSFLKIHC